jgi:hypothetical protein
MSDQLSPEELAQLELQRGLEAILAHPLARKWLCHHLERTGLHSTSFSSDPLAMAFNEGRRNEGLRLLHEIRQLEGYGQFWTNPSS